MSKKTCSIEGCSEVILCKDLCQFHYKNLNRYGHPLGDMKKTACSMRDCSQLQFLAGLCKDHFEEKFSNELKPPHPQRICRKKDCQRSAFIKHFCNDHYQSLQIHYRFVENNSITCIHTGCSNPVKFRNLCAEHYSERRKQLADEHNGRFLSCKMENCFLPAFEEDLCYEHFLKHIRKEKRKQQEIPKEKVIPICKEPKCNERAKTSGYCSYHRLLHKRKTSQ